MIYESAHNANFIDIRDYSANELEEMLSLSLRMKKGDDNRKYLEGQSLGLFFSQVSTRTRISFQMAIRQLGGYSEFYKMNDLQLSNHESLADTAAVLGRYLDGLIIRNYDMNQYGLGRDTLLEVAKYSNVPVINALDDKDHPCQAMTDILTLKEKYGAEFKNRKIVLTWAYADRKKSPGVPHSLLSLAALLGMNFTVAHPKGFDLESEYVEFAKRTRTESGASIEFVEDLEAACEGADVIYAKSWKALGATNEQDTELRNKARPDWTVEKRHFDIANEGAYFMNCMPIIRGQQATAEVVDGPNSIILDEAENRVHAQKGILAKIFGSV